LQPSQPDSSRIHCKGACCGLLLLQGVFREENFNTAMTILNNAGDAGKGDQRGRRGGPVGEL